MNLSNKNTEIKAEHKLMNKKILVAEDEEVNYFLIATILKSYNYEPIHAANGQEALNIFKAVNDIALILMDIQMPVMDGLAATTEIRKIDEQIPIIVQTAFALRSVKENARQAGCNDFISKPINSQHLINKICKHI